ncbi:MAG: uroporphyrinogen decarboxylase [Caulobacterales bacterium]
MGEQPSFLRVLAGEKQPVPPIWLMRQAGRYLPEYRELRSRSRSFLDFCYAPSMASEATLQPIRRFGFDAAIIFSDILVVPDALGRKVWFVENEGPKLEPIAADQIASLDDSDLAARMAPVYEAIERTKAALPANVPLIGFCGAPWTLATYMIKGSGGDKTPVRVFAHQHPKEFDALMDVLAKACAQHLALQVKAGVDAVQIFESWAEGLDSALFERAVTRPTQKLLAYFRAKCPAAPVISFPRAAGGHLRKFLQAVEVDAVGIDFSLPAEQINELLPPNLPAQGRIDPATLVAGGAALDAAIDETLAAMADRPHIFNLGHGILPSTPIAHVEHMIKRVRENAR